MKARARLSAMVDLRPVGYVIGLLVAMLGVGFFAIFHGYAHGKEMPETAEPVLYALGFLVGTALIHIAGVVIGDIAGHYSRGKVALRIAGVVIAVIGVLFIVGVL